MTKRSEGKSPHLDHDASNNQPDNPDDEIIAALMYTLDCPAFRTPFHYESSLPRFRVAIAETIDTLNTGHFRGRQISSKYQICDHNLRSEVDRSVTTLVALRAVFDKFLRTESR